jgi:ligand-binding sensor domain-containing protein
VDARLTGCRCLAQTADGFLWIGTVDGLFRFDGVHFERFRPQGGELPALSVSALLAAPDGGLWVGYSRGRASFISNTGQVVNYSEPEGLPVAKVRSFARTPDGAVWVAAIGGLARFDGGRWQKVRMDWNYPCRSAWRLFVDRQGRCGSEPQAPTASTSFRRGRGDVSGHGPEKSALGIAQAPDGTVFVIDDDVHAVPRGDNDPRDLRPIARLNGQQLTIDRDGGVWIAGFDIVRVRVPDRAPTRSRSPIQPLERLARDEGLSGKPIESDVLEDREGMSGCNRGGLDRFRNRI